MAQNIVKFLVRRGLNADRIKTTLEEGELGFTTDPNSRRLFIGTGFGGGVPVATRFYCVADWSDAATLQYVQPNDILFVRGDNALYALSAVDAYALDSYIKISQL